MWCSKERLENFKCHFYQERLGNFKCHFYQTSNIKRTETLDRSANPGSTFSMQRKYGYFILGVLSCCIQRDLSGLFLNHTFHLIKLIIKFLACISEQILLIFIHCPVSSRYVICLVIVTPCPINSIYCTSFTKSNRLYICLLCWPISNNNFFYTVSRQTLCILPLHHLHVHSAPFCIAPIYSVEQWSFRHLHRPISSRNVICTVQLGVITSSDLANQKLLRRHCNTNRTLSVSSHFKSSTDYSTLSNNNKAITTFKTVPRFTFLFPRFADKAHTAC